MDLIYKGPGEDKLLDGSALPLPEGWPAEDHKETDRRLAQEKLDSGLYKRADEAKPAANKPEKEG